MRFDGLDLNLLVAFDVLIEEKNVSAAARRLKLTQPAVTGALNRLRDYFRDDILVLHGRHMLPTPRAEALADPIRRALLQIRGEITCADDFDPRTARRHFVVSASDYAYTILLAGIIAETAAIAPHVSYEIIPPSTFAESRLDRAEVDLMFTVSSYANRQYPLLELWRDEEVLISWRDADYGEIDIDTFFSAGHAVATFGPDRRPTVTDEYIARSQRHRRIEVLLPGFADLCQAIVGTQRLASMHRLYAEHFARIYPLSIHCPWHPFPEIREAVQWHGIRDRDPGVHWLLGLLKKHAIRLPDRTRLLDDNGIVG